MTVSTPDNRLHTHDSREKRGPDPEIFVLGGIAFVFAGTTLVLSVLHGMGLRIEFVESIDVLRNIIDVLSKTPLALALLGAIAGAGVGIPGILHLSANED